MTGPPLNHLFPPDAASLLEVKGADLVKKLGVEELRAVVADVLCGVNLRNATETLTRRRITLLNAALVATYLKARDADPTFPGGLPDQTRAEYQRKGVSAADKRVLLWTLGLTSKQVQNVLRSDDVAWAHYVNQFTDDLVELATDITTQYGDLQGQLALDGTSDVDIDWLWMAYLTVAIGAQTLATRGSEKSMYGKFFEKLVLGSVLHLMGLTLVEEDDTSSDKVFWLSSRGKKRESDATALFGAGVGVRFDIGFIGTGNTEVSLDKVSRFEREAEIGGESHFMHTFIIVDRIGARSRIVDLAEAIDGTILQMSASYWPRDLGARLEDVIDGFRSPFRDVPAEQMRARIEEGIANAPLETILEVDDTGPDEETGP